MSTLLVTGGTGTFGQAFIRAALEEPVQVEITAMGDVTRRYLPGGYPLWDRVVVFSRDELKQHHMRQEFQDPRLRWFIGDVRDRDRLRRALNGVDTVVHAAALKQVDTCEYNPIEAVRTNIEGVRNLVDAALDAGVRKVLNLGTDKAVDPTNLYGATKLVGEKLIVDANAYSGSGGPRFASTRYGNVISSRGSVVPLFQQQARNGGPVTITDPGMTRFVLTVEQGVEFISQCVREMTGGEVFVPKLPAASVATIAQAVAPTTDRVVTGLRPGEKRHELLISEHESGRVRDIGWAYMIGPAGKPNGGDVPAGFRFGSDTARQLTVAEFAGLAGIDYLEAA